MIEAKAEDIEFEAMTNFINRPCQRHLLNLSSATPGYSIPECLFQ